MAYTPFKMRGNPMKRNFGIGAAPAKMKKSPMKKDDKTLVAKSDSMDVAHDKFMKDRMKVLQDKARKSSDSLNTVRGKVIKKAVEKKKKTKSVDELNKEIDALNKKRSGMKMKKESPTKMMKKTPAKKGFDKKAHIKKYPGSMYNPKSEHGKLLAKAKKSGKTLTKADFEAATKRQAAKDKKKSPAKKPLVGKQKNLPEELKKKILASPSKMKKESMAKMKKESAMKMKKESMAKMKKETAMKMKKKSAMKMKKEAAMKMKKSAMKMKMKKKK